MIALPRYSEAVFGLIASVLALAQTLVGNNTETHAVSSASNLGGLSKSNAAGRQVHVSVHTRTHVDTDDTAVVQLELADWAKDAENEKRYGPL